MSYRRQPHALDADPEFTVAWTALFGFVPVFKCFDVPLPPAEPIPEPPLVPGSGRFDARRHLAVPALALFGAALGFVAGFMLGGVADIVWHGIDLNRAASPVMDLFLRAGTFGGLGIGAALGERIAEDCGCGP